MSLFLLLIGSVFRHVLQYLRISQTGKSFSRSRPLDRKPWTLFGCERTTKKSRGSQLNRDVRSMSLACCKPVINGSFHEQAFSMDLSPVNLWFLKKGRFFPCNRGVVRISSAVAPVVYTAPVMNKPLCGFVLSLLFSCILLVKIRFSIIYSSLSLPGCRHSLRLLEYRC